MSHPVERGGKTTLLPRGSLTVSRERELLVDHSQPSAFEQDGTLAADTRCFYGETPLEQVAVPKRLVDRDVARIVDQEAVWAGPFRNHFGHFLTEAVTRLWATLQDAKLAGLPVVFTAPTHLAAGPDIPATGEWLDAFGVEIIELPEHGVVSFTKMFVPEPAWRQNTWVAPEMRDIHLQARRGLRVSPRPRDDVLLLSRQGLPRSRIPYDEALLEWILAPYVTIIRPETLTLAEQVEAIEGSRALVGTIGSAFHTLLMTKRPPQCLYLCPPWESSSCWAQHRLLDVDATFAQLLSPVWTRRARARGFMGFPFGYRVHIPETLRALSETVHPDLLNEPWVAGFADPARHWTRRSGRASGDNLDAAVANVLLEPFSSAARMRLGSMFEEDGLTSHALEQFLMVGDLDDGDPRASLRAAQLLSTDERHEEASFVATQALAINPDLREAADYVIG